jgi:hypothetical protein
MLPADFDGAAPPAGAPCYFSHLRTYSSQNLEIYEFDVDWSNTSNSTFTQVATLTPAAFNPNLNGVPQPGTNTRLDDLGMMMMYRLQYRNFGSYQTLVTNHTVNAGSGRTGVRWYELRKETDNWYIYQQGTYAPNDGQYRWMGSIAMNGNGDIALGFSLASASTYPSISYVGRRADATLGEMNLPEIMIIGGTGSQSGIDRWGDYSCLSVDPSDDSTFWFTTEYQRSGWKTRIASFDFGPILPPYVFAGNDTTICESEPFMANANAMYQQSVLWETSGDGFFNDPTRVDAIYLRGQGDLTAGHVTLWVLANGYIQGQEDSDTLELYFSRMAKANAGPDTNVCAGESIMIFGSATNQDSVLWKSDGDGTFDVDTALTPVYSPGQADISAGYVWLRLTAYDSLPCESFHTDKMKLTIDQCTGLREDEAGRLSLQVVPNPANTRLNFTVEGVDISENVVISLTNPQGEVLFTMRAKAETGAYSNTLDVSRFPKGVYFLKANFMQFQATQKVVIQ